MTNRFQHEINVINHFTKELEEYLDGDDRKAREEAEAKLIELEQEFMERLNEKEEEIRELKLKVSQSALERGKLLKRLEEYEPSDDNEFTYKRKSKAELYEMAMKEAQRQSAHSLMEETLQIENND